DRRPSLPARCADRAFCRACGDRRVAAALRRLPRRSGSGGSGGAGVRRTDRSSDRARGRREGADHAGGRRAVRGGVRARARRARRAAVRPAARAAGRRPRARGFRAWGAAHGLAHARAVRAAQAQHGLVVAQRAARAPGCAGDADPVRGRQRHAHRSRRRRRDRLPVVRGAGPPAAAARDRGARERAGQGVHRARPEGLRVRPRPAADGARRDRVACRRARRLPRVGVLLRLRRRQGAVDQRPLAGDGDAGARPRPQVPRRSALPRRRAARVRRVPGQGAARHPRAGRGGRPLPHLLVQPAAACAQRVPAGACRALRLRRGSGRRRRACGVRQRRAPGAGRGAQARHRGVVAVLDDDRRGVRPRLPPARPRLPALPVRAHEGRAVLRHRATLHGLPVPAAPAQLHRRAAAGHGEVLPVEDLVRDAARVQERAARGDGVAGARPRRPRARLASAARRALRRPRRGAGPHGAPDRDPHVGPREV
ncbi:MAG: hypothetical protein AVDCRST_MAG85-3186, partial [uncultured Solirubrobacteraceae bacterium]